MRLSSSIYEWPGRFAKPNVLASADIQSGANSTPASPIPPSMVASSVGPAEMGVPSFSPAQFGNAQIITPVFAAAGDQLVLPRPATGQRVFLLIVNNLAASVANVNFDNIASAAIGIQIQPGGNLFMDQFVPQNDIHIFIPIAGVITVAFCVLNATDPTRILQANS
ncbi:MAG: hypothetical protein ACYDAK_12860 [Candidatus Limnocylindrales bacterium]